MNPLNILIFLYIFYQIETYSNIPEFFLVNNENNCKHSINQIQIENKFLCICEEEYATEPWYKENIRCNYKRKKQILVFFLEVIGFGIGHLYAHKIGIGITKLIYWLICIIFCFLMRKEYIKRGDNDNKVIVLTFISFILNVALIIWYVFDLASIGTGSYLDGNDIELYYWDNKKRFNGH